MCPGFQQSLRVSLCLFQYPRRPVRFVVMEVCSAERDACLRSETPPKTTPTKPLTQSHSQLLGAQNILLGNWVRYAEARKGVFGSQTVGSSYASHTCSVSCGRLDLSTVSHTRHCRCCCAVSLCQTLCAEMGLSAVKSTLKAQHVWPWRQKNHGSGVIRLF